MRSLGRLGRQVLSAEMQPLAQARELVFSLLFWANDEPGPVPIPGLSFTAAERAAAQLAAIQNRRMSLSRDDEDDDAQSVASAKSVASRTSSTAGLIELRVLHPRQARTGRWVQERQ